MYHSVKIDLLEKWICNLLETLQVKPQDAINICLNILEAEKMGVNSHGLMLLPLYASRIRNNGINKNYHIKCTNVLPHCSIVDGDFGPGQSIAFFSADKCAELASKHGMSIVVTKNSNHVGMLASYGLRIANRDLIGIVMTNTGPSVSVPGFGGKLMGNNAMCFAVPQKTHPVIFDFATGVVSCNKVAYAALKNEQIPIGWIRDKNNNDTVFPNDLEEGGSILPFGDYKGFGLSFMIDVLTGIFSGGRTSLNVHIQSERRDEATMSTQTLIAINPKIYNKFFETDLQNYITQLKNKNEDILIPGEKELQFLSKLEGNCISIEEKLIKILNDCSKENNFRPLVDI